MACGGQSQLEHRRARPHAIRGRAESVRAITVAHLGSLQARPHDAPHPDAIARSQPQRPVILRYAVMIAARVEDAPSAPRALGIS